MKFTQEEKNFILALINQNDSNWRLFNENIKEKLTEEDKNNYQEEKQLTKSIKEKLKNT